MSLIRQSSNLSVLLGPFVDKIDGVTELTGLTPVVKLSKNGAAFAARFSPDPVVHAGNGWYQVPLSIQDTDTPGRVLLMSQSPGTYLPVLAEFTISPQNVYDALVAGTVLLNANAATVQDKLNYQLSAAGLDALLRTPLTEGYAAKGAMPTLEEALCMILSYLFEKEFSGLTVVTKKIDGANEAMRFITSISGPSITAQTRQL